MDGEDQKRPGANLIKLLVIKSNPKSFMRLAAGPNTKKIRVEFDSKPELSYQKSSNWSHDLFY